MEKLVEQLVKFTENLLSRFYTKHYLHIVNTFKVLFISSFTLLFISLIGFSVNLHYLLDDCPEPTAAHRSKRQISYVMGDEKSTIKDLLKEYRSLHSTDLKKVEDIVVLLRKFEVGLTGLDPEFSQEMVIQTQLFKKLLNLEFLVSFIQNIQNATEKSPYPRYMNTIYRPDTLDIPRKTLQNIPSSMLGVSQTLITITDDVLLLGDFFNKFALPIYFSLSKPNMNQERRNDLFLSIMEIDSLHIDVKAIMLMNYLNPELCLIIPVGWNSFDTVGKSQRDHCYAVLNLTRSFIAHRHNFLNFYGNLGKNRNLLVIPNRIKTPLRFHYIDFSKFSNYNRLQRKIFSLPKHLVEFIYNSYEAFCFDLVYRYSSHAFVEMKSWLEDYIENVTVNIDKPRNETIRETTLKIFQFAYLPLMSESLKSVVISCISLRKQFETYITS